jgi:sulfur carrier protein
MNLVINGENRFFSSADTLDALVKQLGMKSDRVAIELNRNIVPRDGWAQTRLKDGDQLEIVQFVGGGNGWTERCGAAAERVSTRRATQKWHVSRPDPA